MRQTHSKQTTGQGEIWASSFTARMKKGRDQSNKYGPLLLRPATMQTPIGETNRCLPRHSNPVTMSSINSDTYMLSSPLGKTALSQQADALLHNNSRGPSSKGKHFRWLWEVLSLITALLALIGIWGVLYLYDGKSLPDFPYRITLNTIVSLLAQVFSVSIGFIIAAVSGQAKWNWFWYKPQRLIDFKIFDGAVSGPVGAARLLLTRRIVFHSLATASALLMIVALAVGPFTQQLVKYESRAAQVGIASIPRSTQYDDYTTGAFAQEPDIVFAMKAAYYNGLYNYSNQSLLAVNPTCSTGNCTWSDFSSLGVCAECVNSTASIKKSCITGDEYCSYTLPSGLSIIGGGSLTTLINSTCTYSLPSAILSDNVPGLSFYNSTLVQLDIIANPMSEAFRTPAVAYSCNLYLCIKTYHASVQSGQLNETPVATFPNASTPSVESKILFDPAGNPSSIPNLTFVPDSEDGISGGPYGVTGTAVAAMSQFLSGTSSTSSLLVGWGQGGIGEQSFTTGPVQVLWDALSTNSSSQGVVLESIATGFTNVIRTDNSSSGSTMLTGAAWENETYVNVQWLWICLPLAVLGLTVLTLGVAIWQTSRIGVECFKSDSLPTLFAGLTETKRREYGGKIVTPDDMVSAAEAVCARLTRSATNGEYHLS